MKKGIKGIQTASIAVVIVILQSCFDSPQMSPQIQNEGRIEVVNGRLSFPSEKSYFETLSKVNKMTDEERDTFQSQFRFSSLLSSVDTLVPDSISLKRLPTGYQAVLNSKGEITIGDTIVWYAGDGRKHYVPNLNEEELTKIKQGLAESKVTRSYSILLASSTAGKEADGARFIWNNPHDGWTESRWQHEFCLRGDCSSRRKYVDELWMTVDGRYYTLYIVPKMEWYGNSSHRWNANASEIRYVSLTLDCTVQLTDGVRGVPSYVHLSKAANVSGNWNIFINDDILKATSNYAYWDIDIRGTIYQVVLSDANSGWTFEGYPLW